MAYETYWRGEWFDDTPSGYSGEGYLGKRYRGSPRGIDYERNWGNEGRNVYGDRDYYGRREYGDRSRRGAQVIEYGNRYSTSYGGSYGKPGGTSEYGRAAGGFAGRGPRGYRRSDDRIREDVCELLTDDPRVDASNIEVRVENGEVTLTGTVQARQDKRLAEDLAERVSGVKDVHNRLRLAVGEAKDERAASPSARH